jgi:hypothetical protein
MTRGPNGEKRPADAIGRAVMVARIATGDEQDTGYVSKNRRNSGVAGAKARMTKLDAAERSRIATRAADARWNKEEATMDVHLNPCDAVAGIYAAKVKTAGLLDVKFLFQNRTEASLTEACKELQKFHDAVESGIDEPLDFGDLDWR